MKIFLASDVKDPEFNPKKPPVLKQAVQGLSVTSFETKREVQLHQAWGLEPLVLGTGKSLDLLDQGATQI